MTNSQSPRKNSARPLWLLAIGYWLLLCSRPLWLLAIGYWLLLGSAGSVPYFNDPGYARDEPTWPTWFMANSGYPSKLYLHGVYQSQETGTNDLDMATAWGIRLTGVKVGVLYDHAHGNRVAGCVLAVSPFSEIYNSTLPRWYAANVAEGISDCFAHGCKVIVVPGGYGEASDALKAVLETNDCVVLFAAPLTGNLDTGPANYPYHWNRPNVLVVNATDRNGQWWPSAIGTNCVAAPGRNIVAAGTYSSGTSYSAPIAAGVAALVWARHPGWTASEVVAAICQTATPAGLVRRINPVAALEIADSQRPIAKSPRDSKTHD